MNIVALQVVPGNKGGDFFFGISTRSLSVFSTTVQEGNRFLTGGSTEF
jgi:hypothetical protein